MSEHEPPPFEGFVPHPRAFFAELDRNQNREWFTANRARYEAEARGPMASLITSLSLALAVRGVPLMGDPKRSLFRVNRDIRFSSDKRPYKTTVSAILSRDGEKQSPGVFYVQCGLNGDFAAVGFYRLPPDQLTAFRQLIVADRARWARIDRALVKAGLRLSTRDAAARLPRGIDAEAAAGLESVLKLKSFIVSQPLNEAEVADPALVTHLADFASRGLPLLEFGWQAILDRH